MAKYRNRKHTRLEVQSGGNCSRADQFICEASDILDSADLNGKKTTQLMRLRLLDPANRNKEVGPDIEIKAGDTISGL